MIKPGQPTKAVHRPVEQNVPDIPGYAVKNFLTAATNK